MWRARTRSWRRRAAASRAAEQAYEQGLSTAYSYAIASDAVPEHYAEVTYEARRVCRVAAQASSRSYPPKRRPAISTAPCLPFPERQRLVLAHHLGPPRLQMLGACQPHALPARAHQHEAGWLIAGLATHGPPQAILRQVCHRPASRAFVPRPPSPGPACSSTSRSAPMS
jgi:hypothetical protein